MNIFSELKSYICTNMDAPHYFDSTYDTPTCPICGAAAHGISYTFRGIGCRKCGHIFPGRDGLCDNCRGKK